MVASAAHGGRAACAVVLAAVLAHGSAVPGPAPPTRSPASSAGNSPTDTAGAAGGWRWPLGPAGGGTGRGSPGGAPAPRVLEPFDPPERRWLAGHRGVDLGAARGDPLRAPAAGVIAFAGVVVDRPVVTIDHGGGLLSSFEPAVAALARGAVVADGGVFAEVGAGGHCSGRCVHWGVRLDGVYIDPLDTISDRRPSVLLPLPPEPP
ncbi:M23 family metallopeptidase [Arthrobacter halodurans]|uniref:M23 family metallopeptidase n=1 Tax=Arthrobacter halodurans TaxID=516699 RepID=A0ABV4UNH0_9MICC